MESDEALFARVKLGDIVAFDRLYERYEKRLFGFLLSQLRNRADAEDVLNEAFMSALQSGDPSFEREGGFRAWLYRIARNLTLNRGRSARRGARALASLPEPAPQERADESLARHELLRALDGAVSRLPPALHEVYHLRSSGLSYEEIAVVLEVPLGTLKSRMNQMVTHLREEVEPWTAR
ncbi:MAG: sigma-70 family RNA polymerase sigma factor [Polyangiaceae bacterium]